MQEIAALHVPFRMARYQSGLKLPLDHAYRLVHLGDDAAALKRERRISGRNLRLEYQTGRRRMSPRAKVASGTRLMPYPSSRVAMLS